MIPFCTNRERPIIGFLYPAHRSERLCFISVDLTRARVESEAEFNITPEQIKLSGVLKELGMYTVQVQLHEHVETEMKVWVVPSAEEMGEEE